MFQVIAEVPTENDSIDPALLPTNQEIDTEYAGDESDELLELLGTLDENTFAMFNATKSLTESKYIEETIETVKNVGRFNPIHCKYCFKLIFGVSKSFYKILVGSDQYSTNESSIDIDELLIPFTPATPNLVRLNRKWQEQLKEERERIRRGLVTGAYDEDDFGMLNLSSSRSAVATVITLGDINTKFYENYASIHPVIPVEASFPTQKSIANEFTLNREQLAAFMIITSHLNGEKRCQTSKLATK